MPRMTYEGPHDAVEVLDLGTTVARGDEIDVPDELVEDLTAAGFVPTAKARKGTARKGTARKGTARKGTARKGTDADPAGEHAAATEE